MEMDEEKTQWIDDVQLGDSIVRVIETAIKCETQEVRKTDVEGNQTGIAVAFIALDSVP